MNVAGYEEVLEAAESVEVVPDFVQKVVSVAGLAILKIVAWSDRGRENPKDALDLFFIMENYANAGNYERLYSDDQLIAESEYDPDIAGITLLGRDIGHIASKATLDQLKTIIETSFERLSLEMMK